MYFCMHQYIGGNFKSLKFDEDIQQRIWKWTWVGLTMSAIMSYCNHTKTRFIQPLFQNQSPSLHY